MNEQRGEIMDFMTKEEFINESNIEIIQKLMERNNGYITAKELEDFEGAVIEVSIVVKEETDLSNEEQRVGGRDIYL